MKKLLALVLALCLLAGCAASGAPAAKATTDAPEIEGLTFLSETPLQYAVCFRIFRYEGGYSVLAVNDGRCYLVVPEGGEIPAGAADYIVLQQPLQNIYLVATAAMSLICALDGIDSVRLSGARQDAWYIDEAADAMAAGALLYAGKYSQPDYELLVSENCDLAIESTMILHSPEVQEKIEELGVPVFIERSSHETHPLGRTEWMKAYAVLLGKEDEAEALFKQQAELVQRVSDEENTEKTVAFFYVTTSGTVSVRKSADYLAAMIELAGGRYIFQDLGDPETATSGVTMTMEEFYATSKDADYLIYNATIDDPLDSIDQLLGKSGLFADFKAVQSGDVWCTGKYLYQATDTLGSMIGDIHTMLTDDTQTQLTFIHKLT